ncbi:MAG: DUF3052 family protein [Phycisphaeraceae bacterium]|nr:DUF3052 family protein [Phycisphaeraceae bacterium]
MAGYSGTPLAKKLGIKPGARLCLLDAPATVQQAIAASAEQVRVLARLPRSASAEVVVAFCPDVRTMSRRLPACRRAVTPDGGVWIAWPKKASGVATDLTEDAVRDAGLAAGLVDNKVCANDDTWSGLRLVIRLKDRPAGKSR